MSVFAGCRRSSLSMVVRIIAPPEKMFLIKKWSFVGRSLFSLGITLRQDDPLDYKIPDLIYLASEFLVESLDHPFLVCLTMANSSKSLLINQVKLVKLGLNPIVFTKPVSFMILREGI